MIITKQKVIYIYIYGKGRDIQKKANKRVLKYGLGKYKKDELWKLQGLYIYIYGRGDIHKRKLMWDF